MSASLRCGLRAAAGSDEVVVLLGDQPGVGAEAVRARARRWPATRPARDLRRRARPSRRAAARRCSRAPASCAGDAGFRDLLGGAAEVECGDLGDPRDIDTRDDLEVMR